MVPVLAQLAIGVVVLCAFVVQFVTSLRQSRDLEQSGRSFEDEPWWERAVLARRMSIDAGLCRVCGKPTSTRCSRCKSVQYCSVSCQRRDWGVNHKFECENLQKQALLAASSPSSPGLYTKPPPPDPNEDAPVPRQALFPYQHYLQLCHNRSSCRRPPVGFTNLGNNCYANAALQCILANRPLRAYLDQGLHTSNCNKPHKNEWCLLCELQILCRRLADAGPSDEVSIRPLLRHLRRFAKTMSYGRQEDAHEFFYSLVNTMEAIQLTNYGGKERFDMRSQETTLVHHVYGGYHRCQVVCGGCGAASRRYEVALDLTLEVPPGVDKLEDALARHTGDEVLDGDNGYACDACKQTCRATRSTCFEVAPNNLVLCLKRFGTGRFGKINKMLVYGEHLDLKPFMAEGAMDTGEVTYSLACVVVHLDQMNSTSFGHYICFVRTADNRWYGCDDARVGGTSISRVLSQNAYMLFYQRDTPKPAPQPGYKRPQPLSPPAAQQPAAAVVAAMHKQQPAGTADTVSAAGQEAVQALQQQEQQQQQVASVSLQQQPDLTQQHLQRQQVDQQAQQQQLEQPLQPTDAQVQQQELGQQRPLQHAAAKNEAHKQQPLLSELSTERLARVSTAPAALVRLGQHHCSKSSDEEAVSTASSVYAGDADVSECSTPRNAAAWRAKHRSSFSISSTASSSIATTEQEVPNDLDGEVQQQQQEQQQQQHKQAVPLQPMCSKQQGRQSLAGGANPAAAAAAGGTFPGIHYEVRASTAELLQLRASLPGVSIAADVAVDVVNAWPCLQRLQLKVPGRFAMLDLPLSDILPPNRTVGAVGGKLYRRRQVLDIQLHLIQQQHEQQQQRAADAGAASSCEVPETVHWHSTDSCSTSSGSENEGLLVPVSSFHSVMSERDLSSFFGRHTESWVRGQMQELHSQGQQQQQSQDEGANENAEEGANGSLPKPGVNSSAGKQVSSKRGKKGSKGKKRR